MQHFMFISFDPKNHKHIHNTQLRNVFVQNGPILIKSQAFNENGFVQFQFHLKSQQMARTFVEEFI